MNTTIHTPSPDRPVSGQGTPAFARVPASHYDLFVGVFVALLTRSLWAPTLVVEITMGWG